MEKKGLQQPTGDEIKKLRLECGLSQRDAGKIIYVTQAGFAKWESGQRKMPLAFWELLNIKLGKWNFWTDTFSDFSRKSKI